MEKFPSLNAIRLAHERIKPYTHETPVLTSITLNKMFGTRLFFKCENFQKVGAFKFRGACNAVFSLQDEEASAGVATHSSGNHAQALALAARMREIPAYIVMPENAPTVKKNAVADYGGQITFCKPTLEARETTLREVVAKTGAHEVHPYNDYRIIAGQATAALEMHNQVRDLDILLVPLGGGGLISGSALATAYLSAHTEVIGVEPVGANDALRSLQAGQITRVDKPQSIADGLLATVGDKTFPIIQKYVKQVVTVSDESIRAAMKLFWERMKTVVEPSGAVGLAAILEDKVAMSTKRVGILVSGGNVDQA